MTLFNCQLSFAQVENCSFSTSDIEGVEVGQMGDRQIYTLFTAHLHDEPDAVRWVVENFEPLEAAFFLSEFINRTQATIISEQSDAQKIKQLAELDRIDWIGIEHPKTETTYVDIANDLYVNDRNFFTLWEQLFNWDSIKTNQLLFLLYEAFVIARSNHSEVFHEIEIYPLEDEDLMIILNNYTDEVSYWDSFIHEDPHVTSDQRSDLFSFIRTTILPIPRLITESEFEALLDQLGIREESRGNIRMLRMAHNNVISFISKRDAAVVQSILELPGNGLLLFGEAHGPGIKAGLIEACQNRNGQL